MAYEVYWGSGSPVSWRVLLALALKQVDYVSHRLDLSKKQHRSEQYLALSPRGTFPILVNGDRIVRDSMAIVVYIDQLHPTPALFGKDAGGAADVWQAIGEHQDLLGAAVETVTRGVFRERGLVDPQPVVEAARKAEKALEEIDAVLGDRHWIAGEAISAADVVYYPTWQRLLRAAAHERAVQIGLDASELPSRFGHVDGWSHRLGGLPGVDATYPPHWR